MATYLTKSDFLAARDCPTKLYYKKQRYPSATQNSDFMEFLADGGYMVEKMATLLFPGGAEVGGYDDPVGAFTRTRETLAAGDCTLFEATILHDNLLARNDILQREDDTLRLIEVKSTSFDSVEDGAKPFRTKKGEFVSEWRPYLEDVAFQTQVLRLAFPDMVVVPHLCIVDKARRAGSASTFPNFTLARHDDYRPEVTYAGDVEALREGHVLAILDVTDEVDELLLEIEPEIRRFAKSVSNTPFKRIKPEIGQRCAKCEYRGAANDGEPDGFRECWGDLAEPIPHVLDLWRVGNLGGKDDVVAEMVAQGKSSLIDIPDKRLKGAYGVRQGMQLKYTRLGEEYIDPELQKLLDSYEHPLHFIDFEACQTALPYHEGMRPYERIAFQWSCHTIREPGGPLVHAEWLNSDDSFPNFKFARCLKAQIGDKGTAFMWHHFERTVLRDILQQMDDREEEDPELHSWLEWISADGRLVDMLVLAKDHYFHPLMGGSLSIKDVLPAVWNASPSLAQDSDFAAYVKRDNRGNLLSPYAALPSASIGDQNIVVDEGVGAILAYQEMIYGAGKDAPDVSATYANLLRQYCKLDTAAMVMIWKHWRNHS